MRSGLVVEKKKSPVVIKARTVMKASDGPSVSSVVTADSPEQGSNEAAEAAQEIERMKKKLQEMEAKLAAKNAPEMDARSVYVGNVDYSTQPKELEDYFQACGGIVRVTIPCNKGGNPKGFAYIEFKEKDALENAVKLSETEFKGRTIQVIPKRTNIYGFNSRGRGSYRARGSYRG